MNLRSGDDKEPPGLDRVGSEIADVFRSHDLVGGGNWIHIDDAVCGYSFEDVRDNPGRAQNVTPTPFGPR